MPGGIRGARRRSRRQWLYRATAAALVALSGCREGRDDAEAPAPVTAETTPHLDEWWAWYGQNEAGSSALSSGDPTDERMIRLWLIDRSDQVLKEPIAKPGSEVAMLVRQLGARREHGEQTAAPWDGQPDANWSRAMQAAWFNNRGYWRFARWHEASQVGVPRDDLVAGALADFAEAARLDEGMGLLNAASVHLYRLNRRAAENQLNEWERIFGAGAPHECKRARAAIASEWAMLSDDLDAATRYLREASELSNKADAWSLGRLGALLSARGEVREGTDLLLRADAAYAAAIAAEKRGPRRRSLQDQRGLLRLHLARAVNVQSGRAAAQRLLRDGADATSWCGLLALVMAGDRDAHRAWKSIPADAPDAVRTEMEHQWRFAVSFGKVRGAGDTRGDPGEAAAGEDPMTIAVLRHAARMGGPGR